MFQKREKAMSTLSGKSLKLVEQLTYLGFNISSTESIRKTLNAVVRLLIIWKSNLFDKKSRISFNM